MIRLPDFSKAAEYENFFYLSCQNSRLGKFLAHYELYKMTSSCQGDIVECGVFKGASFVRLIAFRDLLGNMESKKVIGFDTFGKFPETLYEADKDLREKFVQEAGEESISQEQLREVLHRKGIDRNLELIEGDIVRTVPQYVKDHPELKISLLNLDTDIYEPAVVILEHLYPRIVQGGILVLDDYGVFPGETNAVDEYFAGKRVRIQKFPFAATPRFIVKEE